MLVECTVHLKKACKTVAMFYIIFANIAYMGYNDYLR